MNMSPPESESSTPNELLSAKRRFRTKFVLTLSSIVLLLGGTYGYQLGVKTDWGMCTEHSLIANGVLSEQIAGRFFDFYQVGKNPQTGADCCQVCVYGGGCICLSEESYSRKLHTATIIRTLNSS